MKRYVAYNLRTEQHRTADFDSEFAAEQWIAETIKGWGHSAAELAATDWKQCLGDNQIRRYFRTKMAMKNGTVNNSMFQIARCKIVTGAAR